jgi:hypothetical protein
VSVFASRAPRGSGLFVDREDRWSRRRLFYKLIARWHPGLKRVADFLFEINAGYRNGNVNVLKS